MMPSIYQDNSSLASTKKKRTRLKRLTMSVICVICALLATLISVLVFFNFIRVPSSVQKNVVVTTTYVKNQQPHHPRRLHLPAGLEAEDVFISVKTTRKNHQTRLNTVISTWYQLARDHTYFFTDAGTGDPDPDENMEDKVNKGHLIVTQCGNSHSRQDLCCKMGAEFDAFFDSDKK